MFKGNIILYIICKYIDIIWAYNCGTECTFWRKSRWIGNFSSTVHWKTGSISIESPAPCDFKSPLFNTTRQYVYEYLKNVYVS